MHKQNKYTEASTSKSNPYLQYFSQFKEVSPPPKTLSEFSDGVFLLELAQIIKDFVCVGEVVDVPRTFSHRLTHLKVLFKSIEKFWSNILGVEIEGEEIDLVEVGRSGSPEEVEKLLELFVKTAVQAENKDFFIEKVLSTSQQTQEFLKKIIEKVFGSQRESPRKEKEKRMYDKILELDHENDKLHSVLHQICEEKLELEQRIKVLSQRLAEKGKELEHYEAILREDAFTPQKKRILGIPDTSDRKDSLIDSLKSQISQMAIQHQRQLQALCSEMQRVNVRTKQYQKMKDELALSREIIDSHQQFRAQAQLLENELSQFKAECMSKDNHIACLKERLQRCDKLIVDLQTTLTLSRGDLERKNIQISELIAKLDDLERRMSPRKGDPSNLFTDFPGIINTEAEAYIETNRSLRQELERTRRKLEQSQTELQRTTNEAQTLRGCESQNRKLRELVLEYNSYRGQQNEILVSSLYHLRKLVQGRLC